MPAKKPRLELTWIGEENRPKLEPRILLEGPETSYHAKPRRNLQIQIVNHHDDFASSRLRVNPSDA